MSRLGSLPVCWASCLNALPAAEVLLHSETKRCARSNRRQIGAISVAVIPFGVSPFFILIFVVLGE